MALVSTDDVPAREREEFWEDHVTRYVTPIHIEQVGGRCLRGEIDARPLGEAGSPVRGQPPLPFVERLPGDAEVAARLGHASLLRVHQNSAAPGDEPGLLGLGHRAPTLAG